MDIDGGLKTVDKIVYKKCYLVNNSSMADNASE